MWGGVESMGDAHNLLWLVDVDIFNEEILRWRVAGCILNCECLMNCLATTM